MLYVVLLGCIIETILVAESRQYFARGSRVARGTVVGQHCSATWCVVCAKCAAVAH